jgi:hypothetical protein
MVMVIIMAKRQYEIGNKPCIPEPIASKQKYSICKKCKVQFKQKWDSAKGVYSDWELCPNCRKEQQREKNITYKIDYVPYEYQLKMHNSPARFKIVAGGVRTGKDYSMTFELVKYTFACANEDRPKTMIPKVRAWIVAPSEDIAKEDFVQLRRIIPAELVADLNKSEHSLLTKNGVLFEVKSAYNPESLVGVGLDAVLITEAARIKDLEDVWSNLEGRLISDGRGKNGQGGIALINSSPLGKNYFYKMYMWGNPKNPERDPQWESFRWQTWDNPVIGKKANVVQRNGLTYRQNLEKRMSSLRYRQDYLAEFLSNEYDVFPNFEENTLEKIPDNLSKEEREKFIKDWEMPLPYHTYLIGYDPAGLKDGAPVVVVEKETGKVKFKKDIKNLGWEGQFDYIKYLQKRYNYAPVVFSKTGHEIIPSQFDKRGIIYEAKNEQGRNKAAYIENYSRLIENKYVRVLDDKNDLTERFIDEHKNYQRTVKGTKVTYSNGRGSPHDDFVSAMYMALSDFETGEVKIRYSGFLAAV